MIIGSHPDHIEETLLHLEITALKTFSVTASMLRDSQSMITLDQFLPLSNAFTNTGAKK